MRPFSFDWAKAASMPAPNPGEILLSFVPGVRDWSGVCSGEPVLVLLGVRGEGGSWRWGCCGSAVAVPRVATVVVVAVIVVVVVAVALAAVAVVMVGGWL